jgi:hypothetical protein
MPVLAAIALVLAIASGSAARWRTQADVADEEEKARKKQAAAGTPHVSGTPGKLRWFCWYVAMDDGRAAWLGPLHMSDQDAFQYEFNTKRDYLGAKLYRFVWPGTGVWIYDTRNDPGLLASRDLPNGQKIAGSVGAIPVTPAITGAWPFSGFPKEVRLGGKTYRKAVWQWRHHPSIVAQYREPGKTNVEHLHVLRAGTFRVDHKDEANPDEGRVLAHLMQDVLHRG